MNRFWQKEYFLRASDFDKFHHSKQDKTVFAKGQNDGGDIMFACKLEYL